MVINVSRYEYASDFKNGYAPVTKDGLWGMIDKMDKEVIPCKYDMIGEIHEGLAPVMKDLLWGYVNTEGIEVCLIVADLLSVCQTYALPLQRQNHNTTI